MSTIIQPKNIIEEGDLVIIYVNFKQTYALTVEHGKTFQTRFGALRHDLLIGRTFGSKVDCTKGYVYVLCPTPELYTQNLSHRTQILYSHDIALITTMLNLKPGSVLAEAGTGSGSFTHAAARTLAPGGLLYTFEVDEERYKLASKDLSKHGLDFLVKIAHRDVCSSGFNLVNVVDAVFLDLPRPWEVIESAAAAMKSNALCRFCSFSPCIEQVQRTCDQLRKFNFVEIDVVECIPRTMKIAEISWPPDYSVVDQSSPKEDINDQPLAKVAKMETIERNEMKEEVVPANGKSKFNHTYLSCVPYPAEQPTHTGYLTFATKLPRFN